MTEYEVRAFTFRDYVLVACYSAAMIVLGIAAGFILGAAFGPGMAVLNGFLVPMLLAVGVRTIRKASCATLMLTIYSVGVMALPIWGPPGPHKIVQGLVAGAIYDVVLWALAKIHFGLAIAIASGVMVSAGVAMMYVAIVSLYPAFPADKFRAVGLYLIPVGFAMGLVAGIVGNHIAKRAAE